jgi:hypothetical protein
LATKSPDQTLNVKPEDLEFYVTGGVVVRGKLRDLILLRQTLQRDSRYTLVYAKNSNMHLYVVDESEYMLIQKLKEREVKKNGE